MYKSKYIKQLELSLEYGASIKRVKSLVKLSNRRFNVAVKQCTKYHFKSDVLVHYAKCNKLKYRDIPLCKIIPNDLIGIPKINYGDHHDHQTSN